MSRSTFVQEARELLTERLMQGETVGRFTVAAIVECALNDGVVTDSELTNILLGVANDEGDDHSRIERLVAVRKFFARLIDWHLDNHPDDVRDQVEECVRSYQESQREQQEVE